MIKKIKALKSIRAYQKARGYDSSLEAAQKMLKCIEGGQGKETYSTFEAMEEIYKDNSKIFFTNNYKLKLDYQSKEIECWLDGGDLSGTIGLKEVYHIEWTLKPKLVDWETAFKHLIKQEKVRCGKYVCDICTYDEFRRVETLPSGAKYSDFKLTTEMLQSKWELL